MIHSLNLNCQGLDMLRTQRDNLDCFMIHFGVSPFLDRLFICFIHFFTKKKPLSYQIVAFKI